MLDVNFVRDNLEVVTRRMAERGFPAALLDRFTAIDIERRSLIRRRDDLKSVRNRESEEIGKLMKAGRKEEAESRRARTREVGNQIEGIENELKNYEDQLEQMMRGLPNLPHHSVPIGSDESANQEVRRCGEPPRFSFEPLDHVDLAVGLDILDLERASKITGSRFAILKGAGARLERALIQFCLDIHTGRHGYSEVAPPFIVNSNSLFGTGQLPKFEEDLFKLQDDRGFYLAPTAEVQLTNFHAGEILDDAQLPVKVTAYTPCFRSEAGSYGKDTRGLIRQHQFDKVELVQITRPEESYQALEELTHHAETVLSELGLAYRTVVLSTGDMGFSAAKTYDIEVWLPSQNTYREISSCSNCEAFQARRAQIRFRPAPASKPKAKVEFVHTLNGSGMAIGRLWLALLENYQLEDGSVLIPESLRRYMNGLERISK